MTVTNDTTTVNKRYNLWEYATEADDSDPLYIHWHDAYEDLHQAGSFGQGSLHDMGFRIWDYSTTPPTDVTENNPEGPHMTTPHPGKRTPALTIPENVCKVTIIRSVIEHSPTYVTLEGNQWHMTISCTDAEVLTRIHEVAAAMEAVK